CIDPRHGSGPEVGGGDLLAREVSRHALERDRAFAKAVHALRDREHLADVLLDDEQRRPLAVHAGEHVVEMLDDDGGQAERDLVPEQKAWIRHQASADGEHLLLAAGQVGSRLITPLVQHGKQAAYALERPRPGAPAIRADLEVLAYGQARKDP